MTAGFAGYPDGVRSIESQSPIDTVPWEGTCKAEDCDFDGTVEATLWKTGNGGPDGRTFEYWWACPWCENEHVDERTDADEADK